MKHWRRAGALGLLAVSVLSAAHAQKPQQNASQNTGGDGAALFERKCALCHGPGGTGTMMLGLRLGKERSLLTQRTDMSADFVRAIVRAGLRSMPPLTRVEVTDSELRLIAAYLSHAESHTDAHIQAGQRQ